MSYDLEAVAAGVAAQLRLMAGDARRPLAPADDPAAILATIAAKLESAARQLDRVAEPAPPPLFSRTRTPRRPSPAGEDRLWKRRP